MDLAEATRVGVVVKMLVQVVIPTEVAKGMTDMVTMVVEMAVDMVVDMVVVNDRIKIIVALPAAPGSELTTTVPIM